MDNKITLSVLAQMLSERSGRSRKECEELLRSFFQAISGSLAAGEPVKVRGFGTFKISQVDARMSVDISSGQDFEIPAHNRIVFLPAKELAGAVNAPFEMFETIELAEDLTDTELLATEQLEQQEQPEKQEQTEQTDQTVQPEQEQTEQPEQQEQPEKLEQQGEAEGEEKPEAPVTQEVADSPEWQETSMQEESDLPDGDEDPESAEKSGSRFGHGFIWGMVAALAIIVIGGLACYWLNDEFAAHVDDLRGKGKSAVTLPSGGTVAGSSSMPDEGSVTGSEVLGEIESGIDGMTEDVVTPVTPGAADENPVPTRPSDTPVYDTIRPNSGLGVMARKHYGNYHFWPYIYKENEKILGHPDRITPGTRVVIPSLAKYGVDPKNPADIAKAKNMDVEIYARYRKNGKPK